MNEVDQGTIQGSRIGSDQIPDFAVLMPWETRDTTQHHHPQCKEAEESRDRQPRRVTKRERDKETLCTQSHCTERVSTQLRGMMQSNTQPKGIESPQEQQETETLSTALHCRLLTSVAFSFSNTLPHIYQKPIGEPYLFLVFIIGFIHIIFCRPCIFKWGNGLILETWNNHEIWIFNWNIKSFHCKYISHSFLT